MDKGSVCEYNKIGSYKKGCLFQFVSTDFKSGFKAVVVLENKLSSLKAI